MPKTPARAAKKTAQKQLKNTSKRTNVIIIVSIALFIVIVAAAAFYAITVMPMQRAILTVGKDSIKTSYFLKRVLLNSNGDLSSTLDLLTEELIVKQQASNYGVAPVTTADIDTYMRDLAKGTNDAITDADFNQWLDGQLSSTGLSANEYREIVGHEIQYQRLTDILTANIQSVAPQVHLSAIFYGSEEEAAAAKAEIDGGTDYATVAAAAGQGDGDLGWMPLDIINNADLETTISSLDVGKCSDPASYMYYNSSNTLTISYLLIMVSEKSNAMEMTENQLTTLKVIAVNDWFNIQESNITITFHGLNGSTDLDDRTSTWLTYQVEKLIEQLSANTTTTTTTITTTTTVTTTTTTTITPTTPSTTTNSSTSS